MKFYFINNLASIKSRFNFVVFVLAFLLFNSCTKKEQLGNLQNQTLEIKVVAIDEASDIVAAASNRMSEQLNKKVIDHRGIAINYATSFDKSSYSNNESSINTASLSRKHAATAVNSLGLNIYYRFVLFVKEANTYKYVGHKDALQSANSLPLAFTVNNGSSYKWIAYSYNTSDTITDVLNSSNLTINTAIDKDLLYASGEINIPSENENLKVDIRFKHRLARIGITLKANDFPATIPGSAALNTLDVRLATNSQGYFKTGQLNLLEDKITNVVSTNFTDNLPFVDSANENGDSTRVAYLYTSDFENVLKDITLSVNNLVLQDIYTYRDGNYPNIANVDIVVKANSIVPKPGYSYNPTANFANNSGVKVGNLIWARGNLTYIPATNTYKINKTPNGVLVSAENDYWLYNSLTPWDKDRITEQTEQSKVDWAVEYDPCRKVAPQGLWRLPTESEVEALGGSEVDVSKRMQSEEWNKNKIGKVKWSSKRPFIDLPQTLYTSFKGDNGDWVTFFKTAQVELTGEYYTDFNEWGLIVDDSVFIGISDGNANSSFNYDLMQIDGEQDYFKHKAANLNAKMTIRCVRTYTP
ncbi:fimbrillin family protein [Sphingobacterium rhinopitheci]|uniref:fimbrillin family protein n=1 Tax=Sphingobacterium rhinopitheci TaxID=2781960 RepID=UPI001F52540A|nr:fimbrillin family protein [Sphingobacterium rhinopitheci]MCI0921233.1 hypothetical protein [Sphingobacterium rhinopitheci]